MTSNTTTTTTTNAHGDVERRVESGELVTMAAMPGEVVQGQDLNAYDVQLGRGNGPMLFIGNIHFRCVVYDHKDEYRDASKFAKTHMALKILAIVANKGGRFLEPLVPPKKKKPGTRRVTPPKKETHEMVFTTVDPRKAVEKTCQALRERHCMTKDAPPPGYQDYMAKELKRKLVAPAKTYQVPLNPTKNRRKDVNKTGLKRRKSSEVQAALQLENATNNKRKGAASETPKKRRKKPLPTYPPNFSPPPQQQEEEDVVAPVEPRVADKLLAASHMLALRSSSRPAAVARRTLPTKDTPQKAAAVEPKPNDPELQQWDMMMGDNVAQEEEPEQEEENVVENQADECHLTSPDDLSLLGLLRSMSQQGNHMTTGTTAVAPVTTTAKACPDRNLMPSPPPPAQRQPSTFSCNSTREMDQLFSTLPPNLTAFASGLYSAMCNHTGHPVPAPLETAVPKEEIRVGTELLPDDKIPAAPPVVAFLRNLSKQLTLDQQQQQEMDETSTLSADSHGNNNKTTSTTLDDLLPPALKAFYSMGSHVDGAPHALPPSSSRNKSDLLDTSSKSEDDETISPKLVPFLENLSKLVLEKGGTEAQFLGTKSPSSVMAVPNAGSANLSAAASFQMMLPHFSTTSATAGPEEESDDEEDDVSSIAQAYASRQLHHQQLLF